MVSMKDIRAVARQIGREFRPQKVVLFGSHARGTAGEDSDVDFLIVMPVKGHPARKAAEIHFKIHPPFATDILVRSPQIIRQRLRLGDWFLEDILREGKVLYESSPR
jgi:predicted nucleotidyltransferase